MQSICLPKEPTLKKTVFITCLLVFNILNVYNKDEWKSYSVYYIVPYVHPKPEAGKHDSTAESPRCMHSR